MAKRLKKNLADEQLASLVGQVVTLYLQSGRAIIGQLLSFDESSLSIEGEAHGEDPIISRTHISSFRRANREEAQRHERKRHGSPT